jgi:hypothetical protein
MSYEEEDTCMSSLHRCPHCVAYHDMGEGGDGGGGGRCRGPFLYTP